MNDERMQTLLEGWLRDREVPRPNMHDGVAKVMADVPRARQQGRWWPFPVFHQEVGAPAATDTTTYQARPIRATNGHAPVAMGRTQTMLSPVKLITAAALVFALGGAMLIGQPFAQQQGTQPGVQTTDPTGAMAEVAVGPGTTYFTGTKKCSPRLEERNLDDLVYRDRYHITCEVVTTEQRFNGTQEVDAIYYSRYPYGEEPGPWTWEGVLTEEEGSWQGNGEGVFDTKGASPLGTAGNTFHYGQMTFVGEGAYEGLVAHYYFAGDEDVMSLTGWITSSE